MRQPPDHVADSRATVGGRQAARFLRRAAVLTIAVALVCSLLGTTAQADSLDKQHKQLRHQIHQVKQDMSESSQAAREAAVSLTKAKAKLKHARSVLHKTRHKVRLAKTKDAKLAAKLDAQRKELAAAKKRVARGKRQIAEQQKTVGEIARQDFQQHSGLARLAAFTTSQTMADLSDRIQVSDTLLDTHQAKFDRLITLQHKLDKDKDKQAVLKRRVAADRAAAARNLSDKKRLEHRAESQAKTVKKLTRKRRKAQTKADKAAAADKHRYTTLRKEDKAVQHRIAKRIARKKAEAARRAAAKRKAQARKRAAAKKRHAAAVKQASHTSAGGEKHHSSKGHALSVKAAGSSGSKAASHGFQFPVNGPVTSPYGMRKHPVTHVYKLHDGTDLGASCGTAIHAPYSGTVTKRYFNAGYGNRLFIDHGKVDGSHITTVMNHASSYSVRPGAHVKKGQVIGHVGQTGYATGCHLHLMVYKNGRMINAMSWF